MTEFRPGEPQFGIRTPIESSIRIPTPRGYHYVWLGTLDSVMLIFKLFFNKFDAKIQLVFSQVNVVRFNPGFLQVLHRRKVLFFVLCKFSQGLQHFLSGFNVTLEECGACALRISEQRISSIFADSQY